MAAVSLFWDTNMAAVTSCENTLLNESQVFTDFIITFFQLYEKLLGFSRPVEDKDDEEAYPGLPPAFHPMMDKMAEQENRYEHALDN